MWNRDGWDAEFRLGLIAPHADVGPEAEVQAMLSGLSCTVHSARVHFSPMHPGGLIDDKIAHAPVTDFVADGVLDSTVDALSSAPLNAIGLAFTSSSFAIGAEKERHLLERLALVAHGVPLETTGTATVAALAALGVDHVAVMGPSWFDDDLCAEGESYFLDHGVKVASVQPCGPPGGPSSITPARIATAVSEFAQSTNAEAVFVAGNGQRAIGAIDALERDLDIPILTANQVLLWACLRGSELRRGVHGYGRLFPSTGLE